jgi:hypothetical protein
VQSFAPFDLLVQRCRKIFCTFTENFVSYPDKSNFRVILIKTSLASLVSTVSLPIYLILDNCTAIRVVTSISIGGGGGGTIEVGAIQADHDFL